MKVKYKVEEYIGKLINNWEVISFSHKDTKGTQYWNCKCKCGTIQPVRTTFLLRSLSKNCTFCRNQAFGVTKSPYWLGGEFISSTLYTTYKLSANKRNLSFNISIKDMEDIWNKQSGKCVYTNIELTLAKRNRDKDFNASLDRIDSSIGYEVGNIQWVLKEVNFMKITLSNKRFLELCKIITDNETNRIKNN